VLSAPDFESKALKELGTRHRAAIGVTEDTDAVAVVVSEETGPDFFCAGRRD
jgi:diadenylate cyclase